MLYLSSTGDSVLTVTLYEKCSNITDPHFRWRIVNKDTFREYVFSVPDNSNAPYYYNSFTVTASSIGADPGQYEYSIYEMTSPNDLDLSNSLGIVEKGILIIPPTQSTVSTFTQSDSNTIPVFGNL